MNDHLKQNPAYGPLRRPFHFFNPTKESEMPRITPAEIKSRKANGPAITMLTAYDFHFAKMIDESGIDMILVGDSLGMVVLGLDSTVPVTMDQMLHHASAVSRAVKRALVIGDMPFLSYQVGIKEAIENAGRFLKEAGCDAVKLEGGKEFSDVIRALVRAGIPVMGHVGLTPQTATSLGGFKVQGRDLDQAKKILEDAMAIAEAGCFSIVLECVPSALAELITETVEVPTIGIGAGNKCDGQVLVTNDMIGLFEKFTPKFVKKYVNLSPMIKDAFSKYKEEVKAGEFPSEKESFSEGQEVANLLRKALKSQAKTKREE